jgi:ABC-type multidrug transport system fused ATPase/permease subunit
MVAVLVAIDPTLALVAIAAVPLLGWLAVQQRGRVRRSQQTARAEAGRLSAIAADLLRNVPQDPWLLDGSIAENIAFGGPRVSRAGVLQAGRTARVDEFALALPNGYDSPVGEGGAPAVRWTASAGRHRPSHRRPGAAPAPRRADRLIG